MLISIFLFEQLIPNPSSSPRLFGSSPAYAVDYGQNVPRVIEYGESKVINAYERYTFEIDERPHKMRDHGQVIYRTYYRPSYLDE